MPAQTNVSRLPVAFIHKSSAGALKFKTRRKLPVHQLPFVDPQPGKIGISFWAVPKTGGYFGGCETGKALAMIYIKFLEEHGSVSCGILQHIVLDMFDIERNISPEQNSLRGQAVGFFCELDRWLAGAAKHLDGGIRDCTPKQLLQVANNGLNFDDAAYMDSLDDEEDEE